MPMLDSGIEGFPGVNKKAIDEEAKFDSFMDSIFGNTADERNKIVSERITENCLRHNNSIEPSDLKLQIEASRKTRAFLDQEEINQDIINKRLSKAKDNKRKANRKKK